MRIAIREQLALLVIFTVLLALLVVAVPTWIYVNNHIASNLRQGLTLTASLKASRISSDLELTQTSCYTISSRVLVQDSLQNFYQSGNRDWEAAIGDLKSALSVGVSTGLFQARLFSRNTTGASDGGLLNVTAPNIPDIILPYNAPDGSQVKLGDPDYGYPRVLYPNITYVDLGRQNDVRNETKAFAAEAFPGVRISAGEGLLLGPLVLNETAALVSVSIPVRDNNDTFILGYMTVVALATSLIEVRDSREGLGSTGMVLLIGPPNVWNRFNTSLPATNATFTANRDRFENVDVQFVLPAAAPPSKKNRHNMRDYDLGTGATTFELDEYPAALKSFTDRIDTVNNASSILSTHNEQGIKVSVGYARTQTPLADWAVIVEKARSEAYQPIVTLRNILLGTVFGTAGFVTLLVIPCAHLSVKPIRKLKAATEKTVNPPGYDESDVDSEFDEEIPGSGTVSHRSKKGIMTNIVRMIKGRPRRPASDRDIARRTFKIPGKVDDRKHIVTDELTELTRTFNDMSDELVKQYMSLDEKVADRTKELEASKKAAEAANESKTLFIANLSHELKTPLNAIMGLCAVCMEEEDLSKIRHSLKTVYRSGDLLLHLLEDLLSFSKNQIGQQLSLEEKEFRLGDIRSQTLAIFDKQVREGRIDFAVTFISSDNTEPVVNLEKGQAAATKLPALGPKGMGRLKDMCVWGDQHRILQVIINLVSNSLKFTPMGGRVQVRIKCLGEDETAIEDDNSRTSSLSKQSRTGRTRHRGSGSSQSASSAGRNSATRIKSGTALAINPLEPKSAPPKIHVRERSPTPPPPGARRFMFEFEVEDTGPGIPENMQQMVFEPFVQGDLGLSKKYGGTGLGLSICHQLASLMGGSINLVSTVGKGTTFTMQIPLKFVKERASSTASSSVKSRPPSVEVSDNADTQRTNVTSMPATENRGAAVMNPQPRLVGLSQPFFAADPTGSSGARSTEEKMAEIDRVRAKKGGEGKLRVLVADDNSTNIEVVSRMLKLEDVYDVTIAKDGQEAYDMVKETMQRNQAFDVIFMDVQMPNLDGLQSTRLIREMGYTSPIVALTAFSEESNVRECIDSGMDEFLAKPIRRPALKQVLKKFATIPEEPETSPETSQPPQAQAQAQAQPMPPQETEANHAEGSKGTQANHVQS